MRKDEQLGLTEKTYDLNHDVSVPCFSISTTFILLFLISDVLYVLKRSVIVKLLLFCIESEFRKWERLCGNNMQCVATIANNFVNCCKVLRRRCLSEP